MNLQPRIRRGMITATLALLAGGCVSSTSYDDLERRYKLATLDTSNQKHQRDVVAGELKESRAEISRLERQLAEQRADLAEQKRDAVSDRRSSDQQTNAMKAELQAAQNRLKELEALFADVRSRLASGSLSSKAARQKLLDDVDASAKATAQRPAQVSH